MTAEFWHTRVKITQIPHTQNNGEFNKSWLCDPFLRQLIYGLEIRLNQELSWEFFMWADSENDAKINGESFLAYFEENFPGLTGELRAEPIYTALLEQDFPIYELVLPRKPYIAGEKFHLIKKIIHLFHINKDHLILIYFFWQKDDSVEKHKIGNVSVFDLYKLKIFLRISLSNQNNPDINNEIVKIQGWLDYLTTDIKNIKGERAYIRKSSSKTWKNLLKSNVFWENNFNEHTGPFYRDIINELSEEEVPTFVKPEDLDFTFISDIPLPKSYILKNENIDFLDITENLERKVVIGRYVHHGIPKNDEVPLFIDNFSQSVFIGGQPGTGKTYFLGHISKEFYNKTPDIGILYLNIGKGNQEMFYQVDRIIKYGDLDFQIPYFVGGQYLDKCIQETASYLIASLGLNDPVDKVMYTVMRAFIRQDGQMPKDIKKLFTALKKWYKERPYHDKYQTNILRAIDNRVLSLLSDPVLKETLEYHADSEVPSWFFQWRAGKKIYVDLSMCNLYVKRLLANAIFQMVRALMPDAEAGKLQNLIVIDEAHQILEKSKNYHANNDDFISRLQLEDIFTLLLREFRGKGLGFIIADQTPSDLFDCATKLPSLKVLFRLGEQCIKRFVTNSVDQELLALQKNRQALVLDGVNGKRYIIETLDFWHKNFYEN